MTDAEIDALARDILTGTIDEVRSWAEEGRITRAHAQKILETNSQAFYGL